MDAVSKLVSGASTSLCKLEALIFDFFILDHPALIQSLYKLYLIQLMPGCGGSPVHSSRDPQRIRTTGIQCCNETPQGCAVGERSSQWSNRIRCMKSSCAVLCVRARSPKEVIGSHSVAWTVAAKRLSRSQLQFILNAGCSSQEHRGVSLKMNKRRCVCFAARPDLTWTPALKKQQRKHVSDEMTWGTSPIFCIPRCI